MEKAQEEAERIVAQAQEQAAFLIEERGPDRGRPRSRAAGSSARPRRMPTRSGAARTSTRPSVLVRPRGRGRHGAPEHPAGDRRCSTSVPRRSAAPDVDRARRPSDAARRRPQDAAVAAMTTVPARRAARRQRRRAPRRAARLAAATSSSPASTLDLGEDLRAGRAAGRHGQLARTNRGAARRRRRARRRWPGRAAAACGRSSCRSTSRSTRRSCRASTSRRASRCRPTRSRRRSASTDHHELDLETLVREAIQLAEPIAPAVPAGLPGPLHRVRRATSTPAPTTTPTRRSTRASRRSAAFRADGEGRNRLHSALRSDAPSALARPAPDDPAGPRSQPPDHHRSNDPMGLPKRKVSHARQGDRRAHLALDLPQPRRVPALPRDEALAPRLPELRLLRRPSGRRAQEEGGEAAS